MYNVKLSKQAEKFLVKLPKFVVAGFVQKFEKLAIDPYSLTGVDTITNPKSIGVETDIAYRIRVENYRATYTIEDEILTIFIFEIEHRSKVYRNKK